MECAGCHNERPLKARGLCKTCYTRWQKTGSVEYLRWGKKKQQCTIGGCENDVKSKGLCAMHYQRHKKHGHTDITRGFFPPEWGNIRLHPAFGQWENFRRADGPRSVVEEWRDDFPAFIAGVGERPSRKHRLYSLNPAEPLGPGNFEWSLPVASREEGETIAAYRARYRKAHKEAFPEGYVDRQYKYLYGEDFGAAEYAALLTKQDGRCAICHQQETVKRQGRLLPLCTDHDHGPGKKVRGLLCNACNKMLGYSRDKPSILYAAVAYLIQHGTDPQA